MLAGSEKEFRFIARELGDFVLGRAEYAGHPPLPGLVNLIPYNPRDRSPWQRT